MNRRIVLVDIGQGMTLRGVLPSVYLFASYSARVTARGGQGPYTYTIVDGAAALEAAGIYLDSPTGELISSRVALGGTFPLTIRATSITGAYVERAFAIVVIAEPLSLIGIYPDAIVGVDYSADLQITGGDGTYSNPRVISGTLPAGLALSVVDSLLRLSGKATAAMSRATVVVAVDSATGTATSVQSIEATDLSPPQFSSWRYLQTLLSDNANYAAPELDDSAWPIGPAPFGNIRPGASDDGALAHAFDSRFSPTIATTVNLDQRAWIRRTLTLSSVPPLGIKMTGFFDNGYVMYINGAVVSQNTTGLQSGVTANISAQAFLAGDNVIAVRCDDDSATSSSDASYFDFLLDVTKESDITTSLLNFGGANGSTVFTDTASSRIWTASGNAKIDTSLGYNAGKFDGSGDYLSTPVSPGFDFGTGDFTIECWFLVNSLSSQQTLFDNRNGDTAGGLVMYALSYAGSPRVWIYGSSANRGSSPATLTTGAMCHTAYCVKQGVATVYLNGVGGAPVTLPGGFTFPCTGAPRIGSQWNGTNFLNGFVRAFRVTKGYCRYNGAFTPPAAPFPNP